MFARSIGCGACGLNRWSRRYFVQQNLLDLYVEHSFWYSPWVGIQMFWGTVYEAIFCRFPQRWLKYNIRRVLIWFRCFPPTTHLVQVIRIILGIYRASWWADIWVKLCWKKETSKPFKREENLIWSTLYKMMGKDPRHPHFGQWIVKTIGP